MIVSITPTNQDDVDEFCPGQASPYRVKAWTARIDGRIVGIGGFGLMPNGVAIAFLNGSEDLRGRAALSLHRAVKRAIADMAARHRRIIATCDENIEAAERWLVRLGFVPVSGGKVWEWQS